MKILESTLTSKFQLTFPKRLRALLGVDVGDRLAFLVEGKQVLVVPKPKSNLAAIQALAGGKSFPKIIEELRQSRQEW